MPGDNSYAVITIPDNIVNKCYSVKGGSILVFGDLHLSSTYEGQHVNYLEECMDNLQRIRDLVEEKKPSAVFFLGDLIGVRERNVKDRRFFREILLFFMELNKKCGVYSVKGNHDFGDYSDFDLLVGLGLLKNPSVVDFYGEDGSPQVRFHFINYGDTRRKRLNFEPGFSNVVLCHDDIQIPGATSWYYSKDGIILSSLHNWRGVDIVIAGHIHTPSTEFMYTTIDESSVSLFYPGSPSRVAERIDDCWYMEFQNAKDENDECYVSYESNLFGLRPASEVFRDKEEFIEEKDVNEELRVQSLTNIVKEVMEGRMTSGDLFKQIRVIPGASDRAKNIACNYLQRAIDEVK